ncbi:lysophospholipase L1-like esterase [Streptomyces sp. KhCrAH-43]|uniref:SGNH/GDSL hydrolase family protein n=1 Tax=unclassified Streptomyces TaxID=2593676 RepID=UPI00038051C4|nr:MULTISPECIES: SGNH/GDSL hydrolase family protein [unclassified Streptomyces]MYS38999.1 SGNH/GDSL hydrolase family protein [Streptomyces sp. SID4920]MYX68479.1 SGNH/GDSL hydrolase family protein [Streptomyces sp. SID8373]RAJ49541.1 lysophospholipase L1-like esterase [Streptomyces sp. KhCrAH-43]
MNSTIRTTDSPSWVRTWGASPQAPDNSVSSLEPFADATLRQLVRISGGGRRIRLRLSNEYGNAPLVVGAARVALAADNEGGLRDGSSQVVTFSGRPTVTVPTGAPVLSDPVDLAVDDLARLAISLYLPGHVGAATCHGTFHTLGWLAAGDATTRARLPAGATPLPAQALITAVEVQPHSPTRTVAVLGDSRVDGIGSTPGTDRRWTDLLAERLHAHGSPTRCVVSQGIGGNRLLNHGVGTAALARFDRDILATPGLGHVVIAVGNDLVFSYAPRTEENAAFLAMFPGEPVGVDDVIAAHLQAAARTRAHGAKVYAATIAPYGGSEMYSREGDKAREQINTWIRTSGAFDAVLDFDAAWRDPADPSRIRDDLHMGDHLHGNDAGYTALAECIDLALFG